MVLPRKGGRIPYIGMLGMFDLSSFLGVKIGNLVFLGVFTEYLFNLLQFYTLVFLVYFFTFPDTHPYPLYPMYPMGVFITFI